MSLVIDTNVAVVANGKHEEASDDCVLCCIEALLQARQDKVLVDDAGQIFGEYQKHLSHAGQPGVGDAFFKWLWNNQANPKHCRQVAIIPDGSAGRVFAEFPDDPELRAFDRDDRKFVAVAIASGETPEVLNAVDTDWWHFQVALVRHGIRIRFLCPDAMAD